MESLQLLAHGFGVALQPGNLIFAFVGCFLGTLVGVLPGVGPAGGMAILMSLTFSLDATPAIIMLAALYYGTTFGGTITSILVNVPGEACTAITCLDGHQMAKRGRAGAALAVSAVGSFIGGTIALMGLVLLALPMTELALRFGPPEFFALLMMGLSLVTSLAGRSMLRALMAAALGLLVAMVGLDPVEGSSRFTFDQLALMDGFGIVPVVMGLFGIGEILLNAETGVQQIVTTRISTLVPTRKDLRDSGWPIVRGTVVGFFLGLIPGFGGLVASFASYVAEKRFSKTPEKFGTGMIEGVAGPETANNAHHIASLIPLFTLGVPTTATVAIIMGAFMMNGLIPGPSLFHEHPDVVWGVIASLYLGNLILVVLNLPLIPMWVAVLKIPYAILFAVILSVCVLGAYSLGNSPFDVGTMLGFGVIGYLGKKLDFPLAPFVLTLVLGKLMERSLRQSLEMSQGDFSILVGSPIAAFFVAVTALTVSIGLVRAIQSLRSAQVSVS